MKVEDMRKVFVIGNGFDLSHGMKTKYVDFREYLIEKYNINTDELPSSVSLFPMKSKSTKNNCCKNNASMVVKVIDCVEHYETHKSNNLNDSNLWSKFEDYLGNICPDTLRYDDDGEEKILVVAPEMLRAAVFNDISSYIRMWIAEANENLNNIEPIGELQRLISNNDMFISFNYTTTLELLYDINKDNIVHIHGCLNKYDKNEFDGFQFIIGHGDSEKQRENFSKKVANSIQWMNLYDELTKEIDFVIDDYSEWFDADKYNDVDTIIVHGLSYGNADIRYIKELIKSFPCSSRKTTWFTCSYNYKFSSYIYMYWLLRKNGFRGRIRFFKNWSDLGEKL